MQTSSWRTAASLFDNVLFLVLRYVSWWWRSQMVRLERPNEDRFTVYDWVFLAAIRDQFAMIEMKRSVRARTPQDRQ
jgi:hypothetical protein